MKNINFLSITLKGCVILALLLAISTIFLMTLEYDESWILASTKQLVTKDYFPRVDPVLTTGGVYIPIVGVFSSMGLPTHLAGRLFSLLSLSLLLFFIHSISKDWFSKSEQKLILLTMIIGAPGTIFLGGMAYGITAATLLFLISVHYFISTPPHLAKCWILSGVGLALAAATRATYVPLLPILLFWCLTNEHRRKTYFRAAFLSTLVAILFFVLFVTLQTFLSYAHLEHPLDGLRSYFSSTGAKGGIPRPPRIISFLVKGSLFIPIPLVISALYLTWKEEESSLQKSFLQILTLSGLLLGGFWVIRSPFQHIRYIWPAILFYYIVFGVYIGRLYGWFSRKYPDSPFINLCMLLPIGLNIGSFLNVIRLVALGAGMQTNSGGVESLENHFKAFHLIQEQRKIVDYLKNYTQKKDVIVAFHLPFEWSQMQLSFLSSRQISSLKKWKDQGVSPSLIISHRFSPLTLHGKKWLLENCNYLEEIGGYKIYSPKAQHLHPPILETALEFQLSRFELSRELSLSGS